MATDSVLSVVFAPMRRSDRLFDIIQRLRTARGPTTAAALADELEVTVRTVYRDVATLAGAPRADRGCAGHRLYAAPRLRPAAADVHYRGDRGDRRRRQAGRPHRRSQPARRGRERAVEGDGGPARGTARATGHCTDLRFHRWRAGARERRSRRRAPGHPRRTQAAYRSTPTRKAHARSGRSGRSRSPITCRRR